MTYKAVVFDLDGTLIDTLEDLGNTTNRVLATRGFPTHGLDDYRYFVGDGAAMLISRALPEDNRDNHTINICLDAFIKDYGKNWDVNTRPYDGIEEMLDGLTRRRVKMAVLSNKPHEFTKKCVSGFLRKWTFEVVLGLRHGIPRKPDPAGALEIASSLNIPPERFIYAGDTSIDMNTACAAGMFPVGVLWGFRSGEELLKSGARVLVKNPADILTLLD